MKKKEKLINLPDDFTGEWTLSDLETFLKSEHLIGKTTTLAMTAEQIERLNVVMDTVRQMYGQIKDPYEISFPFTEFSFIKFEFPLNTKLIIILKQI